MSKDRPNRAYATKLANEAMAAGKPTCWAEPFYREARGNPDFIPWADMVPNPNLVEWAQKNPVAGKKTLVVGSGLGDDADYLAQNGAAVSAFDIAPTAVEWARTRFPRPDFFAADLLALPAETRARYDLVVEIYTLQVLPEGLRAPALDALVQCLKPDGRLFILCPGRDDDEKLGELPWGVSKRELSRLDSLGLTCLSFEDYIDRSTGSRRFRALYQLLA